MKTTITMRAAIYFSSVGMLLATSASANLTQINNWYSSTFCPDLSIDSGAIDESGLLHLAREAAEAQATNEAFNTCKGSYPHCELLTVGLEAGCGTLNSGWVAPGDIAGNTVGQGYATVQGSN